MICTCRGPPGSAHRRARGQGGRAHRLGGVAERATGPELKQLEPAAIERFPRTTQRPTEQGVDGRKAGWAAGARRVEAGVGARGSGQRIQGSVSDCVPELLEAFAAAGEQCRGAVSDLGVAAAEARRHRVAPTRRRMPGVSVSNLGQHRADSHVYFRSAPVGRRRLADWCLPPESEVNGRPGRGMSWASTSRSERSAPSRNG
jgi:hypothetical protein